MSAFILGEDGFRQLAAELAYHVNHDHSGLQWSVQNFIGDRAHISLERIAERVQELYAANVRAVNQRYGDNTPITDLTIRVNGTMPRWTPVQLFKNLECLSYQMAEGDVPESQIYKDLETLIGSIARRIVGRSEKYEQAKWGW